MNIKELIADLRSRVNPQYYDQIGTESHERHQVVKALELLRQENERLRKDVGRIEWQPIETAPKDGTHVLLSYSGRVTYGYWLHLEVEIGRASCRERVYRFV